MIKVQILPKTFRELRSNFQMTQRVMKLVYAGCEIYWLSTRMYFGRK